LLRYSKVHAVFANEDEARELVGGGVGTSIEVTPARYDKVRQTT
jgi:hypothetical protein